MRFSSKKIIAIVLMLVMVIELPIQVVAKGVEKTKTLNSISNSKNDFVNAVALNSSVQTSGEISTAGSENYYIFNCTEPGKYSFYTTGDLDTVGYLYDGSQQQLVNNDDDYFDKNFCINYMLEAGKSYYIKVMAHSDKITGKYNIIAEKSSDKIPSAPANIIETNKDYTSITINWDKPSDSDKVKEYDIYRDGIKIANVFENKYKDINLQPGRNYTYSIKACNMYGNYSEESAKCSAATDKDTAAPDTVQGFEASYSHIYYTSYGYKGEIVLSWNPSKDNVNVEGYYVYRDNEKIGEADKNYYSRPEYHDNGLQIKREYIYTIRAYDAAGNVSDESSSIKYTINDDSNNVIDLSTAQSIDCGKEKIVNSTLENQNMLFSFQPSESGYYYIKVDTSSSYSDPRWFKDLSDIYNDYSALSDIKNLTAGEKYYFNFKANTKGEYKVTLIGPDKEAPSKPIISNAQCDSDGRIAMDIAISDNLPYGITYDVYRNGVPIAKKQGYNKYYNNNYCTFIDNDIVAEGTYNYDIVAYDIAGNKSDKATVTVNVSGDYSAIENLMANDNKGSSIRLYWNNGICVKGCKIYRNGIKIGETSESSYTDTGLIPGSKYIYAVRPYDVNGKLYNELTIDVTAQVDDYGNNFNTATQIDIDNTINGQIDYSDDNDFMSFKVTETGNYAINYNGTTRCELYDENHNFLTGIWNTNGCLSQALYAGKTYYIKVVCGTPGKYSLNFVKNVASNIQSCKPVIYTSVYSRYVNITSYLENPYAVGFNVYRNDEKIATVKDRYYNDEGLLPNNKYTYKIQYFDVNGNLSQQSDEKSVTTLSDDYGDDISSAAPLQLDNSTTGIINCGDDKDFFRLMPKQSGNYVISGHFDSSLKITVTDKDGNKINGWTPSGDFSDLMVSLKGDNAYYISISNGNQSGYFYNPINYKISVSLKRDDYGDDTSTAAPVQEGSNIKGAINYSGDKDFFSITPKVSGNYTISGNADTYMNITVLDQSGKEVKSLDVSSDFSRFSVALNENNIYYIQLSSHNSSVNYNFTISLKTNIYAPDKLNAFSTGSHSNYICWDYTNTDNMNYAAGFKIFRDGKQIGDTRNYYYNDTGLNPGNSYIYTIKAYNDFGNISELSSSLSSSTWPVEYSHDYKNPSEISLDTEINAYTYPLCNINGSNSYSNVNCFSFTPDSEGSYEICYKSNSDNKGYLYIEVVDENYIPIEFEDSSILYRKENGSYIYNQPYNQTGQWKSLLTSKKLDSGKKYYILITEYYYSNVPEAKLSKAVDNILPPTVDNNILNFTDSNYTFMVSKANSAIKSFTASTKDNKKIDFKWDVPDNINSIQGFMIYKDNEYIDDYGHPGIYIPLGNTREFAYDQKDNMHTGNTYSILAIYDDGKTSDLYGHVGIITEDAVPPSKPDDFTPVSKGCKFVKLAWAASNDNCGVKGYAIYRNGEKLTELNVDEPNNSFSANNGWYSFNDTSVKSNTKYTYTVRAFDYSGNYSEDSNPLTTTTCDDDYGDDYTSAYDITSILNSDSQIKGTINDTEDIDFFSFIPAQSGLYTFTSIGDTDLCGYLYDENKNILQCNDDINDKDANFYIQQRLEVGKKYYLKVAFQNGRGTGDYTLLTQLKDEIPPSVPQNIRITSLAGKSASICWDESSDNIAVRGYEIYRDGIKIGDTKDLTFKDTGLTQNQKYIYTVKAYDAGSNYSADSAKLEVTPSAPEITVVEPADKSVIGGDKTTIKMLFNRYYDTSSVISIKYSTDGTLWNSPEGTLLNSYNAQDGKMVIPFEWNLKSLSSGTYKMRINIADSDGCSTEKIISYSVDRTPPSDPKELNAETEFKAVKLTWKSSEDDNVSYYKIYRSDSENGAYSSIASVYGNNSFSYEDRSLEYNKNYYYKVTAVDIFDQEGDFSNVSYAMASSDTTPPTVPANLRMDYVGGNSVKIQWDLSTDNIGVLGYEIYRDGTKVGQTNSCITSYTDKGLTTNTTYKYTIRAFDACGNYSDYSKELLAVPLLPDFKSITPSAGSVIGGKSASFQIYVKNMGDCSLAKVNAQYSADCITWKDADCNISNIEESGTNGYYCKVTWNLHNLTSGNYSLKLKLCDSDGNISEKIIPYIVDTTAPGVVQNLKASADYTSIALSWSKPEDDDIRYYKIYRSTDNDNNYELLTTIYGADLLNYKDTEAERDKTYYYKILAGDNFYQEGTYSDTISSKLIYDTEAPKILSVYPKENTVLGPHSNLTVSAEDNYRLAGIKLQYSSDGNTWTDIASKGVSDVQGTYNFSWDTAPLNGSIKVRAVAKDWMGNESSGSYIVQYNIDNQGPGKVNNVKAVPASNSVKLTWDDIPDADAAYFVVEESTSPDGEYKYIDKETNVLGCEIKGLEVNTTYYYRVTAYDNFDNRGTSSDVVKVTTTADTVKPSISSISPLPGCFASVIHLSAVANDNEGVDSLTFQMSSDEKVWKDIATLNSDSKGKTVNFKYDLDISSMPEGSYYVRALAKDTAGNISTEYDTPYMQYMVDRTAPHVVSGFQAVSDSSYIRLKWNVDTNDYLGKYSIYRSTSENGEYTLIKEIWNDEYYDYDVVPTTEYYYKICAVDMAGNIGPMSDPISIKLLDDKEAPAIQTTYPKADSELGVNPVISVIVTDNYKVGNVKAEYMNKNDASGTWHEIDTKTINKMHDIADFKWNTNGLNDGDYIIRYTAMDTVGNKTVSGEIPYKLNLTPPSKVNAAAAVDGCNIKLSWTGKNEPDIAKYRIYKHGQNNTDYREITETKDTSFNDQELRPSEKYYYVVEAVDTSDNSSKSDEVLAVTGKDNVKPEAKAEGSNLILQDTSAVLNASGSTDNGQIIRYTWDFGDGEAAEGAEVSHIYKTMGNYTARVTVYDAEGNNDTAEVNLQVLDKSLYNNLKVNIIDDSNGQPIADASVALLSNNSEINNFTADENGTANVISKCGTYKICAYQTNYKPVEQDINISSDTKNEITIRLTKGSIIDGKMTVHRMTLDEILAAGIDTSLPENQWIYKCEIHIPTLGLDYSGFFGGNGMFYFDESTPAKQTQGERKYTVAPFKIPDKAHPEAPGETGCLIIPAEAHWLKEFFEVTLLVQNQADANTDFVVDNSKVKINLPQGLSLAPTAEPQSEEIDLGSLAPAGSKQAKWIVRGDQDGNYNIGAQFNGILQPFGDAISANFSTKEPLTVYGDKALKMHIRVGQTCLKGVPYIVMCGIENVSPVPVYNLSFKIDEGKSYTLTENEDKPYNVKQLNPGQTSWFYYTVIPTITGDVDIDDCFVLNNSKVSLDYDISFIDDSLKDEFTGKMNDLFRISAESQTIKQSLLKCTGALPLELTAAYDSKSPQIGPLGNGWSHPYETRLEKLTNGNIIVRWDANSTAMYYYDWGNVYDPVNSSVSKDRIKQNDDGSYILQSSDGSAYYFDKDGNLTETKNKQGFLTLFTHDITGKLIKVEEPISGEYISFTYNDKNLITSSSDNMGRTVRFDYDNNNNLVTMTNANGKPMTFTYDKNNRVLTQKDAEGRLMFKDTYDSIGRIIERNDGTNSTKFVYAKDNSNQTITTDITDRLGNKTRMVHDFGGRLISTTDGMGNTKSNVFDDRGNLQETDSKNKVKTTCKYDNNGNAIESVDKTGFKVVNTYDDKNNILTSQGTEGEKASNAYDSRNNVISSKDSFGNTINYTYYDNGLVHTKSVTGIGTWTYNYEKGLLIEEDCPDGSKQVIKYDAVGRALSKADRSGHITKCEYDSCDNITKTTDAKGNTQQFTYDSHGNKLTEINAMGKTTQYAYNGRCKLETVTDALGNKTYYKYNAEEREVEVTDAKGNSTKKQYDANGRVSGEIGKDGSITSYTYDEDGNILTKTLTGGGILTYTYENGMLASETDAAGNITKYEYDSAGRKAAEVNAAGGRKEYKYDTEDNLIQEKDESGNVIQYTYDALKNKLTETDASGNTTKYNYDYNGHCIQETDALGNITKYEYDPDGRLIKETDAKGNSTTTEYDECGRAVKIIDAEGNYVTMEYDAAGNMTVKRDGKDAAIETNEYDDLGRTVKQIDALNRSTTSKYDELGNLIESVDAKGQKSTLSYDNAGRLISVIDALNGKAKETFDAAGNVSFITDHDNNTVTYAYDTAGRLTQEKYQSGRTLSYKYNNLNQTSEETNGRGQTAAYTYTPTKNVETLTDAEGKTSYTYDASGHKLTVTDSQGTIKREYDALGRVTKYTDASGNTIGYNYDNTGNLTKLTYPNGKAVNYEYNKNNKLIKVIDWNNRVTSYSYDNNNKLVTTVRPDGSTETIAYDAEGEEASITDKDKKGNTINSFTYKYDENGNVTQETKANLSSEDYLPKVNSDSSMTYGADNRLLTYNNQNVTYDADGNMTNGPLKPIGSDSSSMTSFKYDSRNRLIQAGTTTYIYDAENSRTAINDNGALIKYVVNPEADMSETLVKTDSRGNTTYYIYGLGLIGEELQSGTYLIFHYDRRGSTITVTDINGNTTDTYTYATYGELISHTGSNSIEFLFNGRDGVMTDSNGLYYMRSRYYNPEIKRFINMDVVRGSLSDARTMNRFAYANGNPVSLVDPFGTSAQQAKYYENMGGLTEAISAIMVQFNMLLGITAMLGPVGFIMMPCLTMILDMMSVIISAMSFDYFSMAQMEYNKLGDYANAERCANEAYGALKNTIQLYTFTFVFPLVISKAGEAVNDLRGSGFAEIASEDVISKINKSCVWDLNPMKRGKEIEDILAKTEYKDWFHIGNLDQGHFPVIDFQKGNDVVSLKTIDPRLSSYSGSGATKKIIDYLDDLNLPITVNDKLANKILDVRIPEGTRKYFDIDKLIKQANQRTIKLVIKEFN